MTAVPMTVDHHPTRRASGSRLTKETAVEITVDVDGAAASAAAADANRTAGAAGGVPPATGGAGVIDVATGIPFFDHMIAQLGKHGGWDLHVRATGDLTVDTHHTVEDVGILLGETFGRALGDKAGVRRFASIAVPLDEALVETAVDLSGRPFLVYDVDPTPEGEAFLLGTPGFDPQLAEEFWRAFVTASAITLHLRLKSGRNTHHILEACFKGVARALRDAVRIEGGGVPSTKGIL